MSDFLKNIFNSVKNLDTKVSDYKKNTKDLTLPSYAFNNWALELMKHKDEEGAIKKLEMSINTGCKNPETYIYYGIYKLKHKQFDEAIENFLRAIRIDRNNAKAYTFLGSAYCDIQNFEQSKRMFKRALRLDPRNAHTYLNYAIALIKMGDIEKASTSFEKANIYSSSSFDVLFVWGTFLSEYGRYEEALEKFIILHNIDPFHQDTLYFLAYCYHKIGEHKLAIEYSQKLLVHNKSKVEIYIVLAESYMFLNNKEKCLEVYEKASNECENVNNSFIFFHSWGTSLQNFNEWEQAIEKFEKASAISPDNFLAPYNLSISYLTLDDKDKAESALLKTIELNPQHTISLFNLGQLYIAKKDYEKAIKYFKDADKISSNHQFCFNIGYCYQMLEDYKNAIKYYEKHLEYNPKNAETLINLSNVYSNIGENEKALRKIRTAYIENKKNPSAILIYAVLLLKNGKIHDAMEKFEETHKLDPDSIFAVCGKCECLTKLNRPKESLEILKKYEEKYSETKDFLMGKLIANLKLYETEKDKVYKDTALNICDKITSLFGEDEWLNKTRENLGED